MYTMYGREAQEGDFVLVQDVAYMKRSADIIVAQVHNGKAYAASAVPCKNGSRRWLRKEVAITVISPAVVVLEEMKLIEMNISAKKAAFDLDADYFATFRNLLNDAYNSRQKIRAETYDK